MSEMKRGIKLTLLMLLSELWSPSKNYPKAGAKTAVCPQTHSQEHTHGCYIRQKEYVSPPIYYSKYIWKVQSSAPRENTLNPSLLSLSSSWPDQL